MTTISQSSKLTIGLVALIITAVAMFVATMVKVEALRESADETNVVTNELNLTLVAVQGELRSLGSTIGDLRLDTKESERESKARDGDFVRLQSEVSALKDRMVAVNSDFKALEARVLNIEISRAGSVGGGSNGGSPPAPGGRSE